MPLAFCGERIMKLGQWLISAGCVILFGTAIYHAADYTNMARAMGASDAKPALIADMKARWLIFSLHLIILSVLAFSASRCASARQLILLCSLIPLLDTLLLLKFVGSPALSCSPLFVCVFGPERTSCQVQHGFRAERPMNENHGRAAPLLDIMQRNAVG